MVVERRGVVVGVYHEMYIKGAWGEGNCVEYTLKRDGLRSTTVGVYSNYDGGA